MDKIKAQFADTQNGNIYEPKLTSIKLEKSFVRIKSVSE